MKAACLFLLASLLCSRRALSLQCYNCDADKETSQCKVSSCGGVCFKGDLVLTVKGSGEKVTMGFKSCAPSCDDASKTLQAFRPEGLPGFPGGGESVLNSEVKNLACCDKDLCNGAARAGRSLAALAGGLLLSLGPLLLALL
ncbi:lymphocyte antigen 6H-like isoform X2 [Sapajus apella]|uniref:Lymphocyte antigen 6H-like isoform X2 n=1 Tax=Sapajus apella TaxID=9515 RepID=A0A6J3FZJ0_SAPAP|nr:lymphocyte antigen 6H-like isoform X2 [Sapajus apella]